MIPHRDISMRSTKSAILLSPIFIFFLLDFLYVVFEGKTKVLPSAPFDLLFFPVNCGQNYVLCFSEICLQVVHGGGKIKRCSWQSFRKTKMKHV